MNQEALAQLAVTIGAVLTAQRLAYVHLINSLHSVGTLDRDDIAKGLENTALLMPEGTLHPEAIAKSLYEIAGSIRASHLATPPRPQ
jgi:hypothetical protein